MITERVVVGARKLVFAISKVLPKGVAVESAAQPNFPAPLYVRTKPAWQTPNPAP